MAEPISITRKIKDFFSSVTSGPAKEPGMAQAAAIDMKSRPKYNEYVVNMNENGKEAVSYADWMSGKR
jgi:hypothetical protein